MKIGKNFYKENAVDLAPKLLGKLICRQIQGEIIKARITETEAYYGIYDTACHASKGKTKRTTPMFFEGGYTYVYLCYGIHNLLNIVTGEKEHPEAVLIRGVEGFNGPGKLTKSLKITRDDNEKCLFDGEDIWLEDDGYKATYIQDKRVGIGYASQEDQDRLWRFILIKND